jgi:hypothetical protein
MRSSPRRTYLTRWELLPYLDVDRSGVDFCDELCEHIMTGAYGLTSACTTLILTVSPLRSAIALRRAKVRREGGPGAKSDGRNIHGCIRGAFGITLICL